MSRSREGGGIKSVTVCKRRWEGKDHVTVCKRRWEGKDHVTVCKRRWEGKDHVTYVTLSLFSQVYDFHF